MMARSNITKLWIFLALVQFFYISVFARYFTETLLGFIIIHSFTFLLISNIPNREPERIFIKHNLKWLIVGVFVTSFISKFSSRFDEIIAFFNYGYFLMRQVEGESTPILLSTLNILFFPSAIVLIFADIDSKAIRRLVYVLVTFFALLDLVVLGTRNVPVFIVGFLIALRGKFGLRQLVWYLALFCTFLIAFGLTTKFRTQEAFDGVFDWAYLITWTVSSQVIQPRVDLMSELALVLGNWVWPVLFLMQYISHSVSEFSYQIINGSYEIMPSFVYFIDQICLIGCTADVEDAIFLKNDRAGSYQTMLSSVLFDFGTFFVIVVIVSLIGVTVTMRLYRRSLGFSWPSAFLIGYVACFAPIENFFYNGLGLVQMIITFAFILIFLREQKR